jgi:hypothetical protein
MEKKMKSEKIRNLNPTHHQIQSAIVEWAQHIIIPLPKETINKVSIIKSASLKEFLIAIPNGGYRIKTEAIRLKKEGVLKGVSDLFLAIPVITRNNIYYGGLWIEIKTGKDVLSQSQKNFSSLMQTVKYMFSEIRSVDEGIKVIIEYLDLKK